MEKYYFEKKYNWDNLKDLNTQPLTCWCCNNLVAPNKGFNKVFPHDDKSIILICPHCNAPNIKDKYGKLVLNKLPGKTIEKLPKNIENIYSEIRTCLQNNCFTSVVMLSRKLIQNIAVHEGAKEGKKFVEYIDYLHDENIIPKKSKSKADSIRTLGNSANHEIENRTEEDANHCLTFIELLLKVNYEFADEEEVEE